MLARNPKPRSPHWLLVLLLTAATPTFAQIDAYWTEPASGLWTNPSNWSTNPDYPDGDGAPTYNAIIDVPGPAYTVSWEYDIVTVNDFTLDSAAATIHPAPFGGMEVLGTANVQSGTYFLDGGASLRGGTWNVAPGTFVVGSAYDGNRLRGVDFNGDIDMSLPDAHLKIVDGLALDGTVTLSGEDACITFDEDQTITSGRFVFDADTPTTKQMRTQWSWHDVTFGPDCLLEGGRGVIENFGTFTNQGVISANAPLDSSGARALEVRPTTLVNEGTLEAANTATLKVGGAGTSWVNTATGIITASDAYLHLNGDWSNDGLIEATNSYLFLGGTFTTAGMGTILRNGGTVRLIGHLDNTGDTLELNAQTGSWELSNGRISGGAVTLADGAQLVLRPQKPDNYLDGVQYSGTLDLTAPRTYLRLGVGTTFEGDLTLGSSAELGLDVGQTFDGKTITIAPVAGWASVSAEGNGDVDAWPGLHH
jgi:hypothetical protein